MNHLEIDDINRKGIYELMKDMNENHIRSKMQNVIDWDRNNQQPKQRIGSPLGSYTTMFGGYVANIAASDKHSLVGGGATTKEGDVTLKRIERNRARKLKQREIEESELRVQQDNGGDNDDDNKINALEQLFQSIVDTQVAGLPVEPDVIQKIFSLLRETYLSLSEEQIQRYIVIVRHSVSQYVAVFDEPSRNVDALSLSTRASKQRAELDALYFAPLMAAQGLIRVMLLLTSIQKHINRNVNERKLAFSANYKEISRAQAKRIIPDEMLKSIKDIESSMSETRPLFQQILKSVG